jgi:hypothetical protein
VAGKKISVSASNQFLVIQLIAKPSIKNSVGEQQRKILNKGNLMLRC